MHIQSSILCTVPVTILENIAFEVTVLDALGPPSDLVSLLLTCKYVYGCLSFDNCRALYARIFRCKFDHRAAFRRMGSRATYSSNLAKQLRVYSLALQRIRRSDIQSEYLVDDLWTAFIMCTENDGKNEAQLERAGLSSLLDNLVRTRLWEDREHSNGWPAESTLNALAIWLIWFTIDYDKLVTQSPEQRKELMDLIRPYVLTALRYPSFHAPDNHFDFPLNRALQDEFPYTLMTPHGFYPLYRQPDNFCLTPLSVPSTLPLNREHAIQLGRTYVSLTQADIIEANSHKSVKLLERGEWDWRSQLSEDDGKLEDDGVWRKGLRGKSALWDNDWHRLTCCTDPWNVPELKGVVYTYGTLDGLWQGRLLMPEVNQYFALVTSTKFPTSFSEQNPRLTTVPVYMRLREHHCINPEMPTLPGGSRDGFDDGVRNAWFPSISMRETGGFVRIEDEANNVVSQYETYVEGRPNSHDEETCLACQQQRLDDEEDSVDDALGPDTNVDELIDNIMGPSDQSDDDDDEEDDDGMSDDCSESVVEYMMHTCNGIQDIIVTGETLPRHGQAWHHFRFYGRVRKWDGLIAIVRVPAQIPELGTFIFRGYIVANQNFVGSWRAWTNNINAIPLEGPFVMSKIYAGKLFDPYALALVEHQLITVSPESGLITDVQTFTPADAAQEDFTAHNVVDLRAATVLPGLVDVHVHFFLHPYSEVSWEDQLTKEVSDLGTEGAGDADIHLRRCMSGPNPLIPGPRYFCANRAIVVTGSYGPKSHLFLNQEGIEGITGAEAADGEVEYYRFRSRVADVSTRTAASDITTFNKKELIALTETAKSLGVKVAAHAAHWHSRGTNGILDSVGVHSIEHGYDMVVDDDDASIDASLDAHAGTVWVPTLAAYYTMGKGQGGRTAVWERAQKTFQRAVARGMENIACGGDTGVFAHGDNALEMQLMVQLGADWRKVLRWGTLGGWECIRGLAWEGPGGAVRLAHVAKLQEDVRRVGDNDVPFGAVRRGFAADIVATSGDLETNFEAAVDKAAIVFVMKGGRVYKHEGRELV
ncbi:hypothetical protein B0H21DRAFT_776357 [Amylocystis lapponica]|nr:hypothetical protein B0H21DRAFT_776357 [Amylocystis lapponica]